MASLRLLRPRELAPLLIVITERDRRAFIRDMPAIMSRLNPTTAGTHQSAATFEGFFFEARDAKGPFVWVENARHGISMGGQWSWSRCAYPYRHTERPFAQTCAA